MLWIYNLALRFYRMGIWFASFFQAKAKHWIQGRKDIFNKLENLNISNQTSLIWIHTASLGEFEQGRPIIEKLKNQYPYTKIFLTFFSPSGYQIRKNYPLADFIFYLPLDTESNARRFLKAINPKLAIFIKYDLWYHYLKTLQQNEVPTILASALFRKDQFYFKPYGQWFKKVILGIDHIFVQNKISKQILLENGISKISIAGDTRVDRVATLTKKPSSISIIKKFVGNQPVFIMGSTWPLDEEILNPYVYNHPKKWRYIIAPHEVSEDRIKYIEASFSVSKIRYSQAEGIDLKNYDLLIIDNIGMLSSLYNYGKVAYIGGGFGKGLHNTLEPIAYGLPVIFGTRYQNFEEANWLVKNGGGFSIHSYHSLQEILAKMEDDHFYKNASEKAKYYIQQNQGATAAIINFIKEKKYLE